MEIDSIENTFKRSRRFYISNGKNYFTTFLWKINKLFESETKEKMCKRLDEAVRYFNLGVGE